jgi:hypothetical protein
MRGWTMTVRAALLLVGLAMAGQAEAQGRDDKRGQVAVEVAGRTLWVPIPRRHMRVEDASPAAMQAIRDASSGGVENVEAFIHRDDRDVVAAGGDPVRPMLIVQRIFDQGGEIDDAAWAAMVPGIVEAVAGPQLGAEDRRRGKGVGEGRAEVYRRDADSVRFVNRIEDSGDPGQYLASAMVRVDGLPLMLFGSHASAVEAQAALDDLITRTLRANRRR